MDNIGDIICERRKDMGLSQIELGELIGVNWQTILRFEKGYTLGKTEILVDILDALGLELVVVEKPKGAKRKVKRTQEAASSKPAWRFVKPSGQAIGYIHGLVIDWRVRA